jgi:hypothetical protein
MAHIETLTTADQAEAFTKNGQTESSNRHFIQANTITTTLQEIRKDHVIPVFLKDNEPLIAHCDFIEAAIEIVQKSFHGEQVLSPNIRLSHPIKGRIPSAKDKPAHLLTNEERTLFYERMMFVIEVPSIQAEVDGNLLSLTIGGVKSYNEDNLYQRSGADQHFKAFIGFQNRVCTNLCVWTDGYIGDLSVKNLDQLKLALDTLIRSYNSGHHLIHLRKLAEYSLTEQQFAQIIGRSRMYQYLPNSMKQEIPPLLLGDTQMGGVVRDFYRDNSFCRSDDGDINLWRLYNLLTGANKSTYIDRFLDRSVNAYNFTEQIRFSLENREASWYLN